MKPLILLYNMNETRRSSIAMLAAYLGIRVRVVAPGEYGQTIGALCGLEGGAGGQGLWNDFSDEMLLMAFFSEALLHRFLDAFRGAGMPPVRLKAMLTETNSQWTSPQLHAELTREEAAMRR